MEKNAKKNLYTLQAHKSTAIQEQHGGSSKSKLEPPYSTAPMTGYVSRQSEIDTEVRYLRVQACSLACHSCHMESASVPGHRRTDKECDILAGISICP